MWIPLLSCAEQELWRGPGWGRGRRGGEANIQWGPPPMLSPGESTEGPEFGVEQREQRNGWWKATGIPTLAQALQNHSVIRGFFLWWLALQNRETTECNESKPPANSVTEELSSPHLNTRAKQRLVFCWGTGSSQCWQNSAISQAASSLLVLCSFAFSREMSIPTLQSLYLVENSGQPDPLLIGDKNRRGQTPVLKATGIFLGPQ